LPPFDQWKEEEAGPLRLRGGASGEEEISGEVSTRVPEAEHQAFEVKGRPIVYLGERVVPCSSTTNTDVVVRSRSPHGIRTRSKSQGANRTTRRAGPSVARCGNSGSTASLSESHDDSDRLEIAPLRKREEAITPPGPSGGNKRRAQQPLTVDPTTSATTSGEKGLTGKTNARPADSSSSSDEEKARNGPRRRRKTKKRNYGPDAFKKAKRNGTADSESSGGAGGSPDSEPRARVNAEDPQQPGSTSSWPLPRKRPTMNASAKNGLS